MLLRTPSVSVCVCGVSVVCVCGVSVVCVWCRRVGVGVRACVCVVCVYVVCVCALAGVKVQPYIHTGMRERLFFLCVVSFSS
jgi:hypothetical protein